TRAWRRCHPRPEAPPPLPCDRQRWPCERPGPVCRPSGASYDGLRLALRAQQLDIGAVMRHLRAIPIAGAVDRELGDGPVGHVGAQKLAAVPRLTVLVHSSSTSSTKPVDVASKRERGTRDGPGCPAVRIRTMSSTPCP